MTPRSRSPSDGYDAECTIGVNGLVRPAHPIPTAEAQRVTSSTCWFNSHIAPRAGLFFAADGAAIAIEQWMIRAGIVDAGEVFR